MIEYNNRVFALHGDGFSCLLRINEYGLPELLHFGDPVKVEDAEALRFRSGLGWGSSVLLKEGDPASCADAMSLVWSGSGRGDYRESPLELDGRPTDFRYKNHAITDGIIPMDGPLPQATGDCQTLRITLTQKGLELDLYFSVFGGVLTRRTVLRNTGSTSVTITKIMSAMVDLHGQFRMTTFNGGWIREMGRHDDMVGESRIVNESVTGATSNRHDAGFLLSEPEATEEYGRVYGFNLIYSGNHYGSAQRSIQGFTRILQGISPSNFRRELGAGECFETPEAVMAYSAEGFGGLSQKMHRFVNECIVPEHWRYRARPVLFNDWEGCMFDFDHKKLVGLAKQAKELGCELFVLDDGWFKGRKDDHAGLGDYAVDRKKLPHGLEGLSKKIRSMGMQFGLWFEPESVNPDSDLYRKHPDWALTDEFEPLLCRHQLLLDLSLPAVQDYIVENVSRILDRCGITYVKWDMNRHSIALGAKAHDYILGLYKVMGRIFGPRPQILLENCSSGGNRFDLAMLTFGPQIWCSDNTDPIDRLTIQGNRSYLYPQSTFGAHVSAAPHAQTLRTTPLCTRGNVSFFGCLGYELDLDHLLKIEKQEILDQILFYKKYRKAFQFGTFHRLKNGWQVSWKEQHIAGVFRTLTTPAPAYETLRLRGLKRDWHYYYCTRAQRLRIGQFGSLVKHVLPMNLNPNGAILRTADRRITLPDGVQQGHATGAALQAGLPLLPGFRGTGYDTNQRTLTDYGSEIYIIEEDWESGKTR